MMIIVKGSRRTCFNTQPPEGGWPLGAHSLYADGVSTHSRPKAAGLFTFLIHADITCFNTQPPEGGWFTS